MAAKKKADPPPPPKSESSVSGSEESSEDEATESPPPVSPPSQPKSPLKKANVSNSKPEVKVRGDDSSEDEGSEAETSEDEGSEEEGTEVEATPAVEPVRNPAPGASGVPAESDSGSDSESDHEVAAKASGKAAVAKPDDGRKRVAADSERVDGKPAKRVRPSTPVPGKSKEDDEIAILTGISDYFDKGSDPFTDTTGFYHFVKKSLNHHDDPEQVTDTVRRLKRRYQSTVSNLKRGRGALPHEERKKTIFELSKMIWSKSNRANVEDSAVASPDGKKRQNSPSSKKVLKFEPESETERELVDGHLGKNLLFSCWKELRNDDTVGFKLLKEGLELMKPSMARMLEDRWKKIEIAKLEMLQKQRDLLQEQMEMIIDALKRQRK